METIHYDNSTDAQKEFIEEKISREIYCLANEEIEYILKKSYEDQDAPFSWGDISNLQYYKSDYINAEGEEDYFEGTYEELQLLIEELDEASTDVVDNDEKYDNLYDTIKELKNLEPDEQEVLQWFFVSGWLARQLEKIGEPVIVGDYGASIWGRTCFGQSIALDPTFWEIFQEGVQNIK